VLKLEVSLEDSSRVQQRQAERLRVLEAAALPHDPADTWAAPLCAQSLLPKIIQLWAEQMVPLQHRSRVVMDEGFDLGPKFLGGAMCTRHGVRGKETFYYDAEYRRLCWMTTCSTVPSSPTVPSKTSSALPETLKSEQIFLCNKLRQLPAEQRKSLFQEWGIPCESKVPPPAPLLRRE
ncbi:hypothetical protein CYMTET_33677, partial [Cymbomonas tetramitiformis]